MRGLVPSVRHLLVRALLTGLCVLLSACAQVSARVHEVTPQTMGSALGGLGPGDTLRLAAGVYRQTLLLRDIQGDAEHPVRIVGGPGVIVRGSDTVTGWAPSTDGSYSASWPVESSMVFIDGRPLRQLGGTVFHGFPEATDSEYHSMHRGDGGIWPGRVPYRGGPIPAGSFWYDKARKRLVVNAGVDPRTVQVEASVRDSLLRLENVSGFVVEDIVFEHANTSLTRRAGAVDLVGRGNTLRRITARANDLVGIMFTGDDNLLEDVKANENGQLGIGARGKRNRFVRVEASGNNTRGFNTWWEAGGFKFVGDGGLRSSVLEDCRAIGNAGDGIWFDWKNDDNVVRRAVSAYNRGFGIHYEASQRATVEDSYVYGNGLRGIYLSDSGHSIVRNNLVVGNALEGIVTFGSERKDERSAVFPVDGNVVSMNLVGWNTRAALVLHRGANVRSSGNLFAGAGDSLRFGLGYPSLLSPAQTTLQAWRGRSQQDGDSCAATMQMPPALQAELARRSTAIDWAALRRQIQAAISDGACAAVPGPRESTR